MNTLLTVASGFALTFLALLALIRWATRRNVLMDVPSGRHQHSRPIPRVGGLALALSLGLGMLLGLFKPPLRPLHVVLLGIMALVGFLDDRLDLRARWKALAGLGVAVVLAWVGAQHILAEAPPLSLFGMPLPSSFPLYLTLLMVMYWSLPQAFNLIDGANGLSLGFALMVTGSLWAAGEPRPYLLGTLLALLALNWPRARHFMGDCGSLALGLLLALLARKGLAMRDPHHILWLFAYPITDVSMVVLIRLCQGRSPAQADRSHLHHQWIDRWPSTSRVRVPLLLFLAALCASQVYVQGPWTLLPWIGLVLLAGQAMAFLVLSVLETRDSAVMRRLRLQRLRRLRAGEDASPLAGSAQG